MIVMKFGGTSVMDASAIERTAQIVKGRLHRRPMVVVSAMSRVTDALLAAGKAAGKAIAGKLSNCHKNCASVITPLPRNW